MCHMSVLCLCVPQSGILAGCVSLHLGHYPLSLVSKQFLLRVEPRNLGGARTAALLRQLHRLQRRLNLLERHSLYSYSNYISFSILVPHQVPFCSYVCMHLLFIISTPLPEMKCGVRSPTSPSTNFQGWHKLKTRVMRGGNIHSTCLIKDALLLKRLF